jgi:hypothetical protein
MTDFTRHTQDSIQKEIAGMQEDDPNLSFTAAWRRLKQQKPHLFATVAPSTDSLAQARALVGRNIKETIDDLRSFYPGMDTSQLFSLARQQNPALFLQAARLENGEVPKQRLVQAVNCRPYIMLRAEDAEELEREVAAGWWSR